MKRRANFSRKIRLLSQVVLLSGSLNFIFLALFSYFLIKQTPFPSQLSYAPAPLESAKEFSNLDTLKKLASLPYEELLAQLHKTDAVEEGYLTRDLALSILVRRDNFDLPRALGRKGVSGRLIKVGEKGVMTLFPSLTDNDYRTILAFLDKEKWPQTSKGLFLELKKRPNDLSLLQAFALTQEFAAVELLFRETKPPLKKKWLLTLVSEGTWEMVAKLAASQQQQLDSSAKKRIAFLQEGIKEGSKTAASLLLLTDYDFCLKKATDAWVCLLLDVLPPESKRGKEFATALLKGVRGEDVHARAKKRLPVN